MTWGGGVFFTRNLNLKKKKNFFFRRGARGGGGRESRWMDS